MAGDGAVAPLARLLRVPTFLEGMTTVRLVAREPGTAGVFGCDPVEGPPPSVRPGSMIGGLATADEPADG